MKSKRSKSSSPNESPTVPPVPMEPSKKIAALRRVLEQAAEVKVHNSGDAAFKTWKNTVERTLIRLFGSDSPEVYQFKSLTFFYNPIMWTLGSDYSNEHRQCFDRDFQILISSLRNYIEELEHDMPDAATEPAVTTSVEQGVARRVFVSHASADAPLVEELIELLEVIGLTHEQIFCTSLAGYGIDLGENFLDTIQSELPNADALVLFVLSERFYASPTCLCEMGATWVLAKEHVPILIPPFDFADVKGVFPLSEGLKINDPLKLNLLKSKIETAFGLPSLSHSMWERKRDRILSRVEAKIASGVGTNRDVRIGI